MTAPDEDYGRRERLLLHHPHQYPPPGPTPPPPPPPGTGERYIPSPSPAQSHSGNGGGGGGGERYLPAPTPPPGERYIPPPAPAPGDRYLSPPGDRYIPPPAPAPGDRYLPSSERYHQSSSTSDRYLASSSPGDRYLPPAPSSSDRYISPPAPAPGDRYLPTPSSERYLPPPAPAPGERYLPPPAPAPGERYLPPPSSTTPGGPGDPYMRRDLGYHHHYRLPHPSYHPHHPHHPSHHQYHPHYHHQHHHQRALPPAPHHRSLNYHPHTPHHVVPSPNRGHIRCCPSPSHYGPSSEPPYLLSSTGSPGGSSSSGSITGVCSGNGSANSTPSAAGAASGGPAGVVMLTSGSGNSAAGSVNANSSSSSSSSASSTAATAVGSAASALLGSANGSVGSVSAGASGGTSNTREYMTSPSPLLPHRGRTPPCNNGGGNSSVSQRLLPQSTQQPPSTSTNTIPSNTTSSASSIPVIEYIGASGGRHVSTPTPPPSSLLPRCSSLNSCDLGIENPLCGSGDVSNSTGSIGNHHHHNHPTHHHHHHQQPPQGPPRRGCSGVIDKLDPQGSTMSLCCGSSRRFATMQTPSQVNSTVSSVAVTSSVNASTGELPSSSTTTTASIVTRPESRQSLAAAVVTTPSHPPLQHGTPHHTTIWRAVSQQQQGQNQGQQQQQQGSPPVTTSTGTGSSSQQQQQVVAPSPAGTPPPSATPACSSGPTPGSQHTPVASYTNHQGAGVSLERSISAPASSHHVVNRPLQQQHGDHPPRPPLGRSMSKSEVVKKYIKRETAVFFGVEETKEEEQKARWLDRRKRLASRKYGSLREEYMTPAPRPPPFRTSAPVTPITPVPAATRQPQLKSAYAMQPRDAFASGRPDVLPGGRESLESTGGPQASTPPRWAEPPVRRKESVARMTFGGLALVVATLTRHRPRPASRSRQWSRSYPSSTVTPSPGPSSPISEDEVFFSKTYDPTAGASSVQAGASTSSGVDRVDGEEHVAVMQADSGFVAPSRGQLEHAHLREQYTRSWRRTPLEMSDSGPEVGCSRIWSRVLDRVFDNSNRRQYGMGVVGRFFGRSMKRSVTDRAAVKEQLDDIEDHRPFFTYWVTTVQVLILIISLACYGLGPIGLDLNHRSGQVLVTSLSLQQVDYQEPENFWIGPRAADLIHLGAKFAPCMRKDAKIIKEIEKGREKERETACCIRNDDSGCVQSSQADCSKTISTWKKWSAGDSGPGGRISGSVCGLDPKYCEAPASIAPYEWPDDITKWPICRKTNSISQQRFRYKDKMAEHMVCEVIGHPCCIGIHGMCRITTKEYCDFVRGYFHEEASLCSQVSCLDDVCGMIPFYSPEVPDQFYRLWTSLFLHAGIFQLLITLVIQYFLMRDLEKLTGSLRIAIIYMGSGVAGNLASAIFVPYRADVGPAGAQFGLLACLIVEVLNVWPMLKHPNQALLKLIAITLVLLLFGLLPWIDNYAHLFGFIFGFLLSYALMPYVSFGPYDRHKKIALIWVCLLSSLFLFAALVILFYVIPVYDCEVCNIFNCLPLTRDFCASQNINFKREEPVV